MTTKTKWLGNETATAKIQKSSVLKHTLLMIFMSSALSSFGQTSEWVEYTTVSGVTIEYKNAECNSGNFENQNLVLLRFTNSNSNAVTVDWFTEIHRNNTCRNCGAANNPENIHTISLEANETIAGDCGDETMIKNRYVFDHFIELVPGMSDTKLTQFELKNIHVVNQ